MAGIWNSGLGVNFLVIDTASLTAILE